MKPDNMSMVIFFVLLQGLVCTLTLTESSSVYDAGRNCSAGACDELDDDEPQCPPDSIPDVSSPDVHCICKPSRCVQPACRHGSHRVLQRRGSNQPGDCCDIYECVMPKEKNCSEVVCPKETTECPPDSHHLPSRRGPHDCCSVQQGCQCLPRECKPANCSQGQVARVVTKGNGKPGTCCSTYQCVESNTNCSTGLCDEVEDIQPTCPPDSALDLNAPGNPCKCKPCEQPLCHPGTHHVIKKSGSGIPGDCCDVYDGCITHKEPNIPCKWEGKLIESGTTLQVDACKTCNCSFGIMFCENPCPEIPSTCSSVKTLEGECCPICISDGPYGCITSAGIIIKNGQRWQEDPCTTCNCVKGEKRCIAYMCEMSCPNPRHVPGECCPVCDVWPEHCPFTNCSEECPQGYITDADGCNMCKCKPANEKCPLNCPNGFVLDNLGNKLCKCVHEACPPLVNCQKNCSHGYRVNKAGCEVCRCNLCRQPPLFECNKTCVHGYRTNDKGCQICKCKASPDQATVPKISVTFTECKTADGDLHEDGETWFDGCRQCYCHGGTEMCNLITCPVLRCSEPIFNSSTSCCPHCPDDTALAPVPHHTMVCYSVDGVYRVEGETWELDSCTRCLCHSGWVLCETRQCPPTPCAQPSKQPGQCCAECPLTGLAPNKAKSCAAHRPHGATWKEKNCRSCLCQEGQEKCFTEKCPSLACDRPVLVKNQCCSICLDQSVPETCTSGNATYQAGEEWIEEPCTRCKCIDGNQVCTPKVCPVACASPIRVPGRCCPVCPDSSELERSGLEDWVYLLIIAVLLFTLLCVFAFGLWQWHRNRQFKLDMSPKSCGSPAYNGYSHQDSYPPRYTSTDRQAKCETYHYQYVPTYDSQPFEFMKSSSFGATEKTALAHV